MLKESYADYNIDLPDNATGQHYTVCPQCSWKRKKQHIKCLGINADKGFWHCFHCGWSGVLKNKREDYVMPIKKYAKPKVIESAELPDKVIDWFANRKITIETLKHFDIKNEKTYFSQSGKEESAVVFPYKRNNEIINYKYRSGKKHFKQSKNAEKIFFNLDCIDNELDYLIICEGEIDALSFHQAGYKYVLSIPDGAPSPDAKNFDGKFDYIVNCEKEIKDIDAIIICADNDEAGRVLEKELSRRLGRDRCFKIDYPSDCKDANEILVKYGKDGIDELIGSAYEYPIQGVFSIKDVWSDVLDYWKNGTSTGFSTGFPLLDKHYTIRPGEMTIWTGYTGHGKSEFLDQLLINLAYNHDWNIGVCSLENLPIKNHIGKLISKYNGVPFHGINAMQESEVIEGMTFLEKRFNFIYPEEVTLDNLLEIAKQLITRRGIKGFVIDPWNELEHKRPLQQQETDYISESLSRVRRFARDNDVHIWIVAHPTKPIKGKKLEAPSLYDISGSANWANKADCGISVFRRPDDLAVDINIKKIRFKEIGKRGEVAFDYDIESGRYKESIFQKNK